MGEKVRKEVIRKSIHISGILYIPSIIYFGKDLTSLGVITMTIAAILFEMARKRRKTAIDVLLREYERKRIPGYIYTGVAFSIITPFFSINACIISAIAAFAGDGISGIMKRVKPHLSIPSFVITSFLISLLMPVNQLFSLASIIIASFFDGKRWEDNFTIPITAALSYEVLRLVFG